MSRPMINAPTENEVLAKIEMVADVVTRNALLALFFWRLGAQAVTEPQAPVIKLQVSKEE